MDLESLTYYLYRLRSVPILDALATKTTTYPSTKPAVS